MIDESIDTWLGDKTGRTFPSHLPATVFSIVHAVGSATGSRSITLSVGVRTHHLECYPETQGRTVDWLDLAQKSRCYIIMTLANFTTGIGAQAPTCSGRTVFGIVAGWLVVIPPP